jgi:hypothetical protein
LRFSHCRMFLRLAEEEVVAAARDKEVLVAAARERAVAEEAVVEKAMAIP